MANGIEIKPLTGVRGAAAVMVMIYHFHLGLHPTGSLSTALRHGYLSVDLFFVLSGFVMAHIYGEAVYRGSFRLGEFLGHRIARIYPLYGLMTVCFLAFALLRPHGPPLPVSVVVSNLLMVQALGDWPSIDPPAWSISVEALAYLLFPLIALLCLRSDRRMAMLTGCACFAAILAMSVAASRHIIGTPIASGELDLYYAPFTIIRCLAGFTLGQLMWRWRAAPLVTRVGTRNSVQLALVAMMLLLMTRTGTDFPIYVLTVALILMLGTDRGVLSRLFSSAPFMLAGRLSFGIYLVHFKALGLLDALRRLFGRVTGDPMVSNVAATIVSALAVMIVAWMLHVTVERPARIAIRRFQARRTAPPVSGDPALQ